MALVSNTKPSTNQKKSIRAAEPVPLQYKCKRRLDRIETECIYRVIDVLCDNLYELKVLQEYVKDDSLLFGITDLELRELLLRHQQIISELKHSFKYDEIVEKMKLSSKSILRYLYTNGLSLKLMIKEKRSIETSELENYLQELRDAMLDKLLTDAGDEHDRNRYILKVMDDTRKSHIIINQLTDTLVEKTAEKEHSLNEKDMVIRQLKGRLDQMIANAGDEQKVSLSEATKQILTDKKTLECKQKRLGQDILQSSEILRKHRKDNHDNESKLRKRKFKMAGELYNWIAKYDQDLGWRQDQIDELQELHNQDLEEISQLEFHLEKLMKEYEAIMEERRLKEEAKIKEMEMQALKRRAIVKIQAVFRGWLCRENFKRAAKKGGKKGGKGGKGKKK